MKITKIIGRELYNSQGWPTVQCEIVLDCGRSVSALVPSGRSVGLYEAIELYDQEKRFYGRGVRKSVENIEHIIAPVLCGQEPRALELDLKLLELDGTPDKSRLGGNTLLAVSMALYRAEALWHDIELYELFAALCNADTVSIPMPLLNIINGGAHADNNLRIQEFMVVPMGITNYRAALELGVLAYHELGILLKSLGKSSAVGLEGGYACQFTSDYEALDIMSELIERLQVQYSAHCMLALDMAASGWYEEQQGFYRWNNTFYSTQKMINFYEDLVTSYPVYFLEDPLSQDDWQGWHELTLKIGSRVHIVGDDLFATNVLRIAQGIEEHSATATIIKPNQIGTIAETLQAITLCKMQSMNTIISHRSSDTEDTFIADLAVGTSAGYIKAGAPCRSEHTAKYNRLLIIEDELRRVAELL